MTVRPRSLPPYAWGSHRSRLVDVLRKDHYGTRLSADDLLRLVTWIDLNAPYYGSYHSVYGDNLYGRAPLGFDDLAELSDLTGLPYGPYRDPRNRGRLDGRINHGPTAGTELAGSQVDFTRPELSPCLAKLDRQDPRYAQALAIIRRGQENLHRQPREDTLGPDSRPVLACECERSQRCRTQQAAEATARKTLSGR